MYWSVCNKTKKEARKDKEYLCKNWLQETLPEILGRWG